MVALFWLLVVQAGAAAAAPAVPPALTEVAPALALRWRALPLEREGRPVSTLAPGRAAVATASGSAVLRVRGAFTAGCAPLATRVFGSDEGRAEVPLPSLERSRGDFFVVLPPALAPAPLREGETAPAAVGLTLPPGCAAASVDTFEAGEDADPDATNLVPAELQRLLEAAPDDEALARWLEAPHPHLWQEQAALALALPRLLGGAPGSRALALGLLGLATADMRTRELAFSIRQDLGGGPTRSLPGAAGTWRVVPAGGHVDLDVRGEEVVRLSHRALVEAGAAMMPWRLSASFDDGAATWLLAHAPVDVEAPQATHVRTRTLTVPAGARRLRLAAVDGAVLFYAEAAHRKGALVDLFQPSTRGAFEEALRSGGLVGQLAAVSLRGTVGRAGGAAVPAALLEVLRAQRIGDPDEAAGWLRRAAEQLRASRTPLERAAAEIVESMIVRVRAARAVAADRPAHAVSQLLELASRRPLVDEDAVALLEADAFAQESLSGSPQALLVVDGLLARRPLDRGLVLARQQAFVGATRWQELASDPGPREMRFLDPIPTDGALAAPAHTRFVAVPRTGAREVELPEAPLPGHLPLLAVAALRPPGAPPVVGVSVDGTPFTVPAVGPLERVDLPARPGRHRVEMVAPAGATELWVNWTGGTDPGRRWRRYVEAGARPLEVHNRDVGAGDILSLTVRVVGPAGGAPGAVALELGADGLRPMVVSVRPGPLAPGAPGELDPELGASAPVEALVPVASGHPSFRIALRAAPPGVRVLVHLCARRRATVAPLPSDAGSPPGSEQTSLETVAALTGRLCKRGPHAPVYLARAAALAASDEAALAREDLVRALGDALDPAARRMALALWRHLDDVGSSAYPETVDRRSSWVHSPGFGLVLAPLPADQRALTRLADDRTALRGQAPSALVSAAGGAAIGEFALLAGARQAERDGAWARAADLWHVLSAAHDDAGLQARAAAAALELPPDPLRDVSAFVDLLGAARIDPHDPVAARLLRRAAVRTRLRPVHEVDDSAGTVTLAGTGSADASVEAALLPPGPRPGELVTSDRQLNLSFDLTAPATVRLVAQVRELRPAGARAVGRPGISLTWARDGEGVSRATCPAGESTICRSGPISLPAGAHTLVVRLDGGLRPAARVTVESGACPANAPCARSTVGRSAEYLLARSEQPVVVSLFGPAAVEVELRPGASAARRQVSLSVLPTGAPRASVRRISLAASTSDASTVETLVLDREQSYRLEVRPARGEVLCRLLLRDGIGTDAPRPPAPPATLAAAGPAPLLPPPDLQQGLRAEVRDGDVLPGWDNFGALTAELAWRTSVDVADAAEVVNNSAQVATLTYRRLVDRLHLTVKVCGEARFWNAGNPSAAGLLHTYFMHPEARWARVLATFDGATQTVTGERAAGAEALVMLEPVATLRSGMHIVSKLGMRWHWQSLAALSDDRLSLTDPDVFNRYATRHPRALFWEEGMELAPLRDLLLYGGGRVTSNPALSLRHPDRVTAMAVARLAVQRFTLSSEARWTWFAPGPDRAKAFTSRSGTLELLYTLWVGHTSALTIGLDTTRHLDLAASELALHLGWELSNGRLLRDHTAAEGENYFYPQRGPGREAGRLTVDEP
jgi:hypothetical protein